MTEEEKDKYYCNRWERRMRFIEECVVWMGHVDYMDMPYSSWKEPYLFADRNVALFCILQEVRKLSNHALNEAWKMREEFLPPLLTSLKNLHIRLNAIFNEKLDKKALERYENGNEGNTVPAPYIQEDVDAAEEERICEAARLIGEVDVRYLSSRIFSELKSLSRSLDDKIYCDDPDVKEKAYRNYMGRTKFEFKRRYDDLKVQYIIGHNLDCIVQDLTYQQQKEILEGMKLETEARLMNHPKYGGHYRQNKAHGWEWNMLVDQFYHEDEAKTFADDLAMMSLVIEELAEVEGNIVLEEMVEEIDKGEAQDMQNLEEMLEEYERGTKNECDVSEKEGEDAHDIGKTNFEKKLQKAYDMVAPSGPFDLALLLAILCAHGELDQRKNLLLDAKIETVPDFLKHLEKYTAYVRPNESQKLKKVQDKITEYKKPCSKDYFELTNIDELETFIREHHCKQSDGTKANNNVTKAKNVFNALDQLNRT